MTVTYFYADHNYFHQIKGTAMGATGVVHFANILIAHQEIKMFEHFVHLYHFDIAEVFRCFQRFLEISSFLDVVN